MCDLSAGSAYIPLTKKDKKMIKKALWVDDERQPWWRIDGFGPRYDKMLEENFFPNDEVKWFVAKNHTDFCHIIREEEFDLVCFDHDLGSEMTGYDCCKYMIDYYDAKGLNLPQVFVQSANPVGKENIYKYINSYKKSKSL